MSEQKEPTSGSPAKEMPRRQSSNEIKVMSKCDMLLSELTIPERMRVVDWLASKVSQENYDSAHYTKPLFSQDANG